MGKVDISQILKRGYKSVQQSEYGRMALNARPRRDACVICGWEGECYRYRENGRRQADGTKIPRVCPNCWQAVKGRGDFNQMQSGSVDQVEYRYWALQRLTDAADKKIGESD